MTEDGRPRLILREIDPVTNQPIVDRPGVGVVVGRFQTPILHQGHHAVIGEADKHHKLCIVVGVRPSQPVTKSDPLDYPAREQMIKEEYPEATVLALPDQPTDEGWSESLDALIASLFPFDKPTLYGGRDSFKGHYTGRNDVKEVDAISGISATSVRDVDGAKVENHESWRRGVIYAAHNRYGLIYPCVDIVVVRPHPDGSGTHQALVGSRTNERGAHRLPGGHVDPRDTGALQAAQRELREETGVETAEWTFIDNLRVKSWRDTPNGGVIFTSLYCAKLAFGPAKAGDDLDNVGWIPVEGLKALKWADDHAKLVERFLEWYRT